MDQKDVLRLAELDVEWKQVYVWNQSFKKDSKWLWKRRICDTGLSFLCQILKSIMNKDYTL